MLVRLLALVSLAGLITLLVACGPAAEPSPTPAPPITTAPTAPPATAPASASQPSPTAAPTQPAPTATAATLATPSPVAAVSPSPVAAAASPTPAASPAMAAVSPTAAAAQSDVILFRLEPDQNEARFIAREQLVGVSLPNNAIGSTREVSGTIVLGPDAKPIPEQSRVTINVDSLRSDESRRDNYIRQNTLQTSRYPTADFVPTETQGLPSPLPASGPVEFQLAGDLTVRDVTRPVVWDVEATVNGDEVTGIARTIVKMTDFGMTPPRVGPVLSIEDEVRLEIDFTAVRGS